MSMIDTYRNNVARKQSEIARLVEQKANEYKKIANLSSKIQSAIRSMNSTSSPSSKQARQKEIIRYQEETAKIEKSIADFEHKIAQKNKELHNEQKKLSDEEIKESKKQQDLQKKQFTQQQNFQKEQLSSLNAMSRTLSVHHEAILELQALPNEITVLFFASNPRDQVQLSLDEEVRSIKEMISKAKHRDSVRLESCWAVRSGDILQHINESQPTIVHFSGHGSEEDELVLMDNNRNTKLVSLGSIVQAISVANDNLRLVFFNTCYSNNQARNVVDYVDAAIGMKTSISDDAARIFSAQFYSSIGFGLSVEKSFNQAKAALMLEGINEEDTPELFIKDGVDASNMFIVSA